MGQTTTKLSLLILKFYSFSGQQYEGKHCTSHTFKALHSRRGSSCAHSRTEARKSHLSSGLQLTCPRTRPKKDVSVWKVTGLCYRWKQPVSFQSVHEHDVGTDLHGSVTIRWTISQMFSRSKQQSLTVGWILHRCTQLPLLR